jgi:phosphoribosylglycinamide formyltransferase 1
VRVGVLASHEGTTLQALIDGLARRPEAAVAIVISNNGDSGALRRAGAAGIATAHLSGHTHPDPDALDAAITETLSSHGVELLILAGYMKKLGARTLSAFAGRILNTHPALLPKFGGQGMYGMHVHRAVLAAGEKVTGVSVHVVTAEYDAGPVIAQREVPVAPADTPESLAERVQAVERRLLVDVVLDVARGRISLPRSSA